MRQQRNPSHDLRARAKPGGNSILDGWYYDKHDGSACYRLGEIKNIPRQKGQPVWVNTTDLFYITWEKLLALGYTETELTTSFGLEVGQSIWIFDFLQILEETYGDTDYYSWKLDNNGNKHIQLRFYK